MDREVRILKCRRAFTGLLGWQVGRVVKRYYRLGQEDVHGYDADDRLYSRNRSFEEHERCHWLGNFHRSVG